MSTPASSVVIERGTARGYCTSGMTSSALARADTPRAMYPTRSRRRHASATMTSAGTSSSGLTSGPPTASGNSVIVGAGTTTHIDRKNDTAARASTNQDTPQEYPAVG